MFGHRIWDPQFESLWIGIMRTDRMGKLARVRETECCGRLPSRCAHADPCLQVINVLCRCVEWHDYTVICACISLSIYIYIIIYNYIYRWYMSCHVSYVIHHTSYIICHLSYTIACHVMSCHVMSCHIMSCHVMSCHVMMYIMTYFIVSYRICPSVCAPLVSKNLPESSPLKSRFLVCGLAVYYRCLWRKLPFCAHRVYYVFCHHWMHLTILTNGQSASNHS